MGRAKKMLAVSALSAVALVGCGSSGGGATAVSGAKSSVLDPAALVAASYTKMTAAKTAKLDLSMKLSASGAGGGDFSFTGTGAEDFAKKAATLSLSLPEGKGTIDERVLEKTVYEKLPATEAPPALKGKWVKIDLDKAAQAAGLGSTGDTSNSDPTQILQMLSSVSDGVTKVGDEQVRGVNTHHFRAVVDLGKVSAKAGNSPAQIDRLKQMLGTSSYPVDIWVDDSGLTHRLQFQMPLPKQTTQGSGLTDAKMVATEEFYDFGTPVSVEAPPAADTVDISQLSGTAATKSGKTA
jgi:hypothetical protein